MLLLLLFLFLFLSPVRSTGISIGFHSGDDVVIVTPLITYDDQLKSPQSLRGGQKFVIETTIGGIPTPSTGWTRNGQPLTPGPKLAVEATATSSKLTITDASADLSGTYVLKAENAVGAATAEFVITVKGFHSSRLHCVTSFCNVQMSDSKMLYLIEQPQAGLVHIRYKVIHKINNRI